MEKIQCIEMDDSAEKIIEIEKTIDNFSHLIRSAIRKTSPSIDQSDMDDIEQEVKIKIWKEIQKSEKEILNLGSYIWKVTYTTTCKIMKNLFAKRRILFSRDKAAQNVEEKIVNGKTSPPNHQFETKEMLTIIRESVDSLLDSRRQVLKLYLLGMDSSEITDFLGWSEGKTRNLLSRGLSDLRENLKEKGIEF